MPNMLDIASPFTEFYCIPASGNNTFAGSTTGPPILIASGCGWQSGTGGAGGANGANYISFTGTQDLSILTSGMFAAVSTGTLGNRPDVVKVLGIITGADNSLKRVWLHSGKLLGRIQTMSGASVKCVVGGPWLGPTPTGGRQDAGFPINFLSGGIKNNSGDLVRLNMHNGAQYNVTGYAIPMSYNGPVIVQGYSLVPGDTGRCVFSSSGGNSILNNNIIGWTFNNCNFIIRAVTGADAMIAGGSSSISYNFINCYFSGSRRYVLNSNSTSMFYDCEFTDWGKGAAGAAVVNFTTSINRCYFHDATGLVNGCVSSSNQLICVDSVLTNIGGYGLTIGNNTINSFIKNNDFYKIGGHAILNSNINLNTPGLTIIENCNFIQCSGFYNSRGSTAISPIIIRNCVVGSGTNNRTSGIYNGSLSGVLTFNITEIESGTTPWMNPNNKDFRIINPVCLNAGRQFITPMTGNANILTYPDIGATQHIGTARFM